jgi:hypothetical protein
VKYITLQVQNERAFFCCFCEQCIRTSTDTANNVLRVQLPAHANYTTESSNNFGTFASLYISSITQTLLSDGSHFRSLQGRHVGITDDRELERLSQYDAVPTFIWLAGVWSVSLHHRLQTDHGSHPASYPISTGGSFRGVKGAGP